MKHIPKENIKVSLSVGFLASLQDRHNERYSKHEAFCYLLYKACEHYVPKSIGKDMADLLEDFQFITTKTQLAEDWHWHRATVRQFLEKLTRYRLMQCKDFETKYTAIKMLGMEDGNVPTIQNGILEPIIRFTFDSWLNGTSSTEETAIVCGQIVKGAMVLATDSSIVAASSDHQLSSDDIATYMIGRLVDYTVPIYVEGQNKLQLCNATNKFFTHTLCCDWLQLLLLIRELPDIACHGKTASVKLKTTEDMNLFQSLCSTYKACCPPLIEGTANESVADAKADTPK